MPDLTREQIAQICALREAKAIAQSAYAEAGRSYTQQGFEAARYALDVAAYKWHAALLEHGSDLLSMAEECLRLREGLRDALCVAVEAQTDARVAHLHLAKLRAVVEPLLPWLRSVAASAEELRMEDKDLLMAHAPNQCGVMVGDIFNLRDVRALLAAMEGGDA